ncbi:RNHCP domain-containing protein [Candidatus Peregrinibacteria bacterium CG11_big_fil_rev_8_21_14_0_20_41_10]|nr:MAG: RNHCP domain-containing protein [Candidatus Peregrinibacteria bacterium CG11_big_fil_rev_8_21_14_0_20_41_10]PIZ76587.1 MAG: RNHCP domain-containing protein [Candidatus Peregrinibacteria bacterium CG_4_10_14_0_2_um_filter_41_8]PJC37673.1 MAG: RNHCP domain-containing protein [Candidatus Peregrinibacteria bacterium CG_4_9_14_0_2_um_filter_41_14]
MQTPKNFIYKNKEFTCQKCGTLNPIPPRKIRNHCLNCLYSLHLDLNIPGDRASNCKGLMAPMRTYQNTQKGWMIEHQCLSCDKTTPNIALDDDNWDRIIELANAQHK